jgi:hypothetical protein
MWKNLPLPVQLNITGNGLLEFFFSCIEKRSCKFSGAPIGCALKKAK